MGKTVRNQSFKNWDGDRPEWQENRGKRYGNQRHQVAELKVRDRRNQRARDKAAFLEML